MTDIDVLLYALAVTFGVGFVAWLVLYLGEIALAEITRWLNQRRRERLR